MNVSTAPHPTKWTVVIDRGPKIGIRLYETEAEARAVAFGSNVGAREMIATIVPPEGQEETK